MRSKSFRDVRPYHLGTRARILFSCLYHWFWGVDQLNPFIDTEIIFQKMMVIPRTWCSSAKRENFNLMPQILRLSLVSLHTRELRISFVLFTNIVESVHEYCEKLNSRFRARTQVRDNFRVLARMRTVRCDEDRDSCSSTTGGIEMR